MSKKKESSIILVLCIVSIVAVVYFFLPNDEKKIRNNLNSLAQYCSTPAEETGLAVLKNMALATKLCHYPCTVEIQSISIGHTFTKKELSDHILLMKKSMVGTHFSFHDTRIEFPEKNSATLTSTLRLNGKTEDNRFTDAYEFNIRAEKIDGHWLFSSFVVVEFMEQ